MLFLNFNFSTMFFIRKIKDDNNASSYKKRNWFLLSAAFPTASMFDGPLISLYFNLKHYDLKLRLN